MTDLDRAAACPYCEVLAGRAEGPPIALDTAAFVSFLGRYQPTGPGYSLVIPRRHVPDLHHLRPEELGPMLGAVQQVAAAVVEAFGVPSTTILQNNGEPAQRVMHLHVHVVPRWPGDGYPCESDDEVPREELERQAAVLRRALSSGRRQDGGRRPPS